MRRVIFVDDEPNVLSGFQRMLRPYRDDWDMRFALRGEDALAELDTEPVDVIVTDMRMPGMAGNTLLEIMRERHPDTVRVVLSGQVDDKAALRMAVLAHQFLGKPANRKCSSTRCTECARCERNSRTTHSAARSAPSTRCRRLPMHCNV